MTHYVFSLWDTTRNLATQAHLAPNLLKEEDEEEEKKENLPPWVGYTRLNTKIKLKISESSTLNLQGMLEEYISF